MTPDFLRIAARSLPPDTRILFAAEVGSRSMGMEVAGSDHDVIAFVASPPRSYLGVRPPRDAHPTIQLMGSPDPDVDAPDVSLTAFDVRHAVERIRKGNVRFLLACGSLKVHVDEDGIGDRLRELCRAAFVPARAAKQFAAMIQEAMTALPGRGRTPRALLHVLHPSLCAQHVLADRSIPPASLRRLCDEIDVGEIEGLIEILARAKADAPDRPVDAAVAKLVEDFAITTMADVSAATVPVDDETRVATALDLADAIAADAIESAERRERYGMGLMIGEMGEALAVLGNALRFGMDTPSGHGEVKPGERERLVEEMGDVAAAARWSGQAGIFDPFAVERRQEEKFRKLVDPSKRDNLGRRLAPPLPDRD